MTAAAALKRRVDKVRRDATMNLRVPKQVRDLFDAAANIVGKTRTEFVVDSARKHAMEVLLDQCFFRLNEDEYAAFLGILDNPPEPNEKLKQLMSRKAPWER
jgi:uncharacterized protein (DUF1778 family)